MNPQTSSDQTQRARAAARRTAMVLGSVAVAIYIAFLLKGVLGA